MIRDELLQSDRFLGLPRNTHRLAFIACVLRADDNGNLEASPGACVRLWRDFGIDSRNASIEVLEALVGSGLLQLYYVNEKQYAHIPRFRQRVRYPRHGCPLSPHNNHNEINTNPSKKTDSGQSQDGPKSDPSRTKRSEVKRREVTTFAPNAIAFDAEGRKWSHVSKADLNAWRVAYPAIDVLTEIRKAGEWLIANPKNRKKNLRRYLVNWFARKQESAPGQGGGPTAPAKVVV